MRLVLHPELCTGCGACAKACPRKALALPAGVPNLCRQCPDAECVKACTAGAIVRRDGVLSADLRKCTSCGACIHACPFHTILRLPNDKAAKCDLCWPDFVPKCAKACTHLALTVQDEPASGGLGWGFADFSTIRPKEIIHRTKAGVIFLDEKGDLQYFVSGLRQPTEDESAILKDCVAIFKEMAREKLIDLPLAHCDFREARADVKRQCTLILNDYLTRHACHIGQPQAANLVDMLTATVGGNLGPLDFLIYDDEFEEITFNGIASKISVKHKTFGRMDTNLFFTDADYAKENIVNRIADFVGEPNISEANPILAATLPNMDRLHALAYPVVTDVAFTIRHFPSNPLTLPQLVANRTLDAEAAAYLWLMMELGRTIFIVGATGTGKTTFLNSLLPLIPFDRRILVLEEVAEICVPHSNTLRHQTRRSQGITLSTLIHSSLRETPDRLVIGEIRTPDEIAAFLEVAQAGPGEATYTTFHGETLETALKRLEHHGISPVDLPGAVHLLILLKRRRESDPKLHCSIDKRYVAEIAELMPDATLNKVYSYDAKSRSLKHSSPSVLLDEYGETFAPSTPAGRNELPGRTSNLLAERAAFLQQSSELSQADFFRAAAGQTRKPDQRIQ